MMVNSALDRILLMKRYFLICCCSSEIIGSIGMKTMVKQLAEFCEQELYNIDVCSECYRNANAEEGNGLAMVCKNPHLLVWARMDLTQNYFPAKAMAITKSSTNPQIHVQFFGLSICDALVNPSDCYLFSKKCPNGVEFEVGYAHRVRFFF